MNFDDNIEIGDAAESMVNFEENLIKEYTANIVNKEDDTDLNESDEEDMEKNLHNRNKIKVLRKTWHSRCSRDRGKNDKCCC